MAISPLNFYYCGYQKCSPRHYFGPAVRTHYLMHFILSGKGTFRVGKDIYHLEKNQAFLICPKDLTYYEADASDPWEYVWFGFDGEEANRLLKQHGFDKENCICYTENEDKMAMYLSQSLTCLKNPENTNTELAGWFYLLFSCLKILNPDYEDNKTRAQAAIDYIKAHFTETITVEDISAHLNVDRTHLYKLCKKRTNLSPKELLTQVRLENAKDLLLYSPSSITEIALSSGFHDSSSFSKKFRKYVKMSPSEYRKVIVASREIGGDLPNIHTFISAKVLDM